MIYDFSTLLDSYEKTKRELGEAEGTIRRITGRNLENFDSGVPVSSKVHENFSASVRPHYVGMKRHFSYSLKKKSGDSSSEEETCEDDDATSPNKKPTLMSTVVVHKHEQKSRMATIEQQNSNSKIKARNRRMFGALIGTLEKFQNEEKKRQPKESKRAEIEKKIEAATEEERKRIKEEKELLFVTCREKQIELRCLEKKIERAESHEVYDMAHHYMQKFIKTKSKPPIFFLPVSHTSITQKCLEESKSKIQELRNCRKEHFYNDLCEIEKCYKKDSMADEKGNRFMDEVESQDIPDPESDSAPEQADNGLDNDNSNITKNVKLVTDQDFEPIYD